MGESVSGQIFETSETHVRLLQDGAVALVGMDAFRRRFGVDGLVRLHRNEFDLIEADRRLLVHFNLGPTSNEVGRTYAVVPIMLAGHRQADGQEVLPILDHTRRRIGTCIGVQRRVPLHAVSPKDFSFSLPNIRGADELEIAFLSRYRAMLPASDLREMIGEGCTITRLELR
ncbi:MAG: hypothetical protein ACRYGP_20095 [Janthinobacterium lividum]